MDYDLILTSIHRLAQYASLAYVADGAEFRMYAPELRGPTIDQTLETKHPSFLTQNTHIYWGIRDTQTVVVVFSGYDSPWLLEDYAIRPSSLYGLFRYVATDLSSGLEQIDWYRGLENARAHKHFLLAFDKLREDLLSHIFNLSRQTARGTKRAELPKIEVCGHGLGGALATLCALWCAAKWEEAEITCVTLGSPKIGDDSFAREFERRNIKCYRLVIESDPFADMPYAHHYRGIPIWQHVGKEIRLPRYQGDVKSFRIIRQASEILEHVTVYLEVSFGWWIMYWWLKAIQLWWNVSVHSPMAYMTSLQKAIEDDISTEGNAATPGRSLRAQIMANFREDAETKFITLSILQAVSNVINTARNIAGDIATRISNKILFQSPNIASKAVREIMLTVGEIILYAETTVAKFRDDTLTTAIHGVNRAFGNRTLSSLASDALLKYAMDVLTAADDAAVVDVIIQVIHRSCDAIAQSLIRAALIWRAIFTNGVNKLSLNFIFSHLPELGQWLYDLVKPGSVLGKFPTTDDVTETLDAEVPSIDNPYNELDLWLPENRNAVVCQAQRVILTIVAILKMGRGKMPNALDDVQLNVSLRSDFDANTNPPPPTYISALHGELPSPPNEKWLFINGLANEFFWFQRSCDKICDTFNREVTGVYNRSDGILWDFIECCGERRDGEPNTLIERTQSSKAAQKALEQELRVALWPATGKVPDKVVMIAHSQGCLVLRLALQTLVTETPKGSPQRRIIKERLRIFTFGNPSIDWKVIDGTEQPLSKYVHTTEHFANETDFVAMLGVVMHRDDKDSGYDPNMVFYSKTGKAHLFGAHYSLGVGAYHDGENSRLLKAVNGTEIA